MSNPSWARETFTLPTISSSDLSGQASGPLNPALPGTILDVDGFDIELVFVPSSNLGSSSFELLSMEGPETSAGTAATRISYDAASFSWNVVVRGASESGLQIVALAAGSQIARSGDTMKVRLTWFPARGKASLGLWVNGNATALKTTTPATTSVGAPTSLYLGRTIANTNQLPAQWKSFKAIPAYASGFSTPSAEIVILGDSICSCLIQDSYSNTPAPGTKIYTAGEYASRRGIATIAVPGHTISQQLTTWNNSRFVKDGKVRAVIIQVGVNDVNAGTGISTLRTDYQALVNKIRSDCPNVKIIISKMTPAKGYASTAANHTAFLALNDSIAGLSSPITGVDARVTSHYDAMCTSVVDFLDAALETTGNDHIHPNAAGGLIMANAWRTALVAQGIL